MINADGLIDEVWASDGPIEPDPVPGDYDWAEGLWPRESATSRVQRELRVETFLEQLFNGLSQASILLLIALGLTFTFGQMGVINMAHGELIMAGAYTPTCCRRRWPSSPGPPSTAFVRGASRWPSSPPGCIGVPDGAAAAAAHVRPAAGHAAGHVRRVA